MDFTFAALILWIRDYGWMVALLGLGVVGLLRRAGHPVLGVVRTLLFTLSSLLLPASIVLQFITLATPPKKPTPPAEMRRVP